MESPTKMRSIFRPQSQHALLDKHGASTQHTTQSPTSTANQAGPQCSPAWGQAACLEHTRRRAHVAPSLAMSSVALTAPTGTCCNGITPASRTEGLGLNPECVHFVCSSHARPQSGCARCHAWRAERAGADANQLQQSTWRPRVSPPNATARFTIQCKRCLRFAPTKVVIRTNEMYEKLQVVWLHNVWLHD